LVVGSSSGADGELVRRAVAEHLMRRRRLTDPWAALAAEGKVIPAIRLVRIDDEVVAHAGILMPPSLRSLDAIHLATTLVLGAAVEAMVCYDIRLAGAATYVGIDVRFPA